MLRDALVQREGEMMGDFRIRGREVSRLEGFSDAAFAFAVTLLVVSLEMPRSFNELIDVMKGLPAFAVCFATIVWLWSAHYKFFRRFGLQDRLTIAINSALLFVIMLYVYPLKFVFTMFMGMLTGIRPSNTAQIATSQLDDLFIIYGLGFIAVFGLLALLNIRAYTWRDRLELSELERLMTRAEIARLLGIACVGGLSVLIAIVLSGGLAGLAGMAYFFIGVVEFYVGWSYGRRKEALLRT